LNRDILSIMRELNKMAKKSESKSESKAATAKASVSSGIKKGDTVKVHYTGTFTDGKVFDSSEGRDPLQFTAGAGMVIPGFDHAVIGMKIGEEKNIVIHPAEAYGESNPQMIQTVPRNQFPEKMELKEGTVLVLKAPTGQQIPVIIAKVTDKGVTIDMNHPLAGKTLHFKVKVV
jgi:FKBP-type peptidyl-prolyl cis-trans isomerase 2